MAVASVVPAKWWRWRWALALATSFLVSLGTSGAIGIGVPGSMGVAVASAEARTRLQASGRDPGRATDAGVTLAVTDTYGVSVPAGSWVPVAVSVVNHRASGLQGQVLVSVPVAQVSTGESCSASGLGFICGATSASPSGYASGARLPEVSYRIPLSLAAGISKQFIAYVLAESPYGDVQAAVRTQSGQLLAKTSARLPVAYGAPQPAVLVVTQDPSVVSTMAELSTPTGSHPQLQYINPADLPASAAALGGFTAVTIDEADTSVLNPDQSTALEGYVDAGGTLVVAGGLDWRAATAGLPAGLLPATVEGLSSRRALSGLGNLLGVRPLKADVDLADLKPSSGSNPTLMAGPVPLAVQWRQGSGQVVFSALDPLAPPLATWPGTAALMSRLFAPAFQGTYYAEQPSVATGPASGLLSRNLGAAPITNLGTGPGAVGNNALLSPTTASQGLLGYLEQMPGASPPTAYVFGLLLLGYVVVAGPLCFWALARLRRRELAWVAVPCLAVVGGLVLYVTGAGVERPAMVNEVRVTQLAPGSHLAQLVSLGAVYLPRGGSETVELTGQFSSSPALIGDLGADAGAQLAVGAATAGSSTGSQQVSLTVFGPSNSLGGWGASGTTHLAGTVAANVTQSNGTLAGEVTNDLGVRLVDVQVVTGSGQESQSLGTLGPGGSARVSLAAASDNGVPGTPLLALPLGGGNRQAEQDHEEALQSLYDLGALYSGQQGGTPVLVAFAGQPLYPADLGTTAERLGPSDAVIVPLLPGVRSGAPTAQLGPELVGSRGALSGPADELGAGSLALQQGGSFDYQFVLPTSHWAHLELSFGSTDGSVTNPGMAMTPSAGSQSGTYPASDRSVVLSAFDYRTGKWDRLRTAIASDELMAAVPAPARYLGPGGTLEIRLSSPSSALNVYGEVPTVSALAPSATTKAPV
jgi:hypothetical protein